MIVNLSWFGEFFSVPHKTTDVLAALTALGFEVEYVHKVSEQLKEIKIGFVLEKSTHPTLPGRYVCQIDVGESKPRQIMCASEHALEVGWGVPVALPGIELPTGLRIGEANYGGITSSGMICLDREMGFIANGSGMQVFDRAVKAGTLLVDAAKIPDTIAELNILPNRPDCMNLLGLAREVVALLGGEVSIPQSWKLPVDVEHKKTVPVSVDWSEACPRYSCRVIQNVKVAKSPMWLSSRLASIGAKSINNIVDATNYMLYVVGHPLHAFNLDALTGPEIIVRRARSGETLKLLDGTLPSLSSEHLVIADKERPVALAGIMGGVDSQTEESTTSILLESAYFHPVNIRSTSSALTIRTESSHRFERGMDPNETLQCAMQYATHMITELSGGSAGEVVDVYPIRKERRVFTLQSEKVNHFLGSSFGRSEIESVLKKIEMLCEEKGTDTLEVQVPTRRVDADDAVVLIEDIARISGYDNIQARATKSELLLGGRSPADKLKGTISQMLSDQGFFEARPFSLYASQRQSAFWGKEPAGMIRLKNPLTQDMDSLRTSLLPSLIDVVMNNQRRQIKDVRFYEVDRTYHTTSSDGKETRSEEWTIAGAVSGNVHERDWKYKPRPVNFFWLKGILENIVESLHLGSAKFERARLPFLHPGQSAVIFVQDQEIGFLGTIHPSVAERMDAGDGILLFQLHVEAIERLVAGIQKFRHLSTMPTVSRDLVFLADKKISYASLEGCVRKAAGELLENLNCFDIYEGEKIPDGKMSVGFSLLFRAPDRTLTAEEISEIDERIVNAMLGEHGASLRQ